jgi:hypothetical protein
MWMQRDSKEPHNHRTLKEAGVKRGIFRLTTMTSMQWMYCVVLRTSICKHIAVTVEIIHHIDWMLSVQNCDSYINIPSSQTYR